MHDWGLALLAPYGWVPMDVTTGRLRRPAIRHDRRWMVLPRRPGRLPHRLQRRLRSRDFVPAKRHFRSETVDSQRGEAEWDGGNLYFDQWDYDFDWQRSAGRRNGKRTQIDRHQRQHRRESGNDQSERLRKSVLCAGMGMCLAAMASSAHAASTERDRRGRGRAERWRRRSRSRNPDTGFSRTVTADADGNYRFPLLPVGNYNLQTVHGGRQRASPVQVSVSPGQHHQRQPRQRRRHTWARCR